ncbi:hypothetical protein L6452_25943 [Arctium lappa]|uniref:Uncharacterized protein n=1 Tax=Arctium lappa TaxID=4217 RepID=A0ACB9ACR2_ARCLA|nr:hypothetical protein L6452_25943 [Arctium lappa]
MAIALSDRGGEMGGIKVSDGEGNRMHMAFGDTMHVTRVSFPDPMHSKDQQISGQQPDKRGYVFYRLSTNGGSQAGSVVIFKKGITMRKQWVEW